MSPFTVYSLSTLATAAALYGGGCEPPTWPPIWPTEPTLIG